MRAQDSILRQAARDRRYLIVAALLLSPVLQTSRWLNYLEVLQKGILAEAKGEGDVHASQAKLLIGGVDQRRGAIFVAVLESPRDR